MQRRLDEGIVFPTNNGHRDGEPRVHTHVQWSVTAAQAAPFLHDVLLPKLTELGAPDDVRLVFYFSS
jgi:hypothetical protein